MPLSKNQSGLLLIALGTIVFLVALVVFCLALGLDFENEGWDGDVAKQSWDRRGMIGSVVGFLLSIVLFFVGVHRVSRSPVDR